jgi:ribosomal protein L29
MENSTDITEQYLDKLYEDLHREQMRLMTSLKNAQVPAENPKKEQDTQKQLTQLNTIMITTLRLRNLRKAIQFRGNTC